MSCVWDENATVCVYLVAFIRLDFKVPWFRAWRKIVQVPAIVFGAAVSPTPGCGLQACGQTPRSLGRSRETNSSGTGTIPTIPGGRKSEHASLARCYYGLTGLLSFRSTHGAVIHK